MKKKLIGKITHFYPKINVAIVELSDALKQGEKILIEDHEQSFEQAVDSMQVEHENIPSAKKGQSIGLKVMQPVKEGAKVYKLIIA